MKLISKTWILPLLLTVVLAFGSYPVQNKYSQSFIFADEAEHMVMGWLVGKGYKLYRDFPNNHQPIPYLVSFTAHQTLSMDNVFMLLKRHRQVIFIWSVLWWFLLMKRFGSRMIVPIIIFESVKYFALGNEFLAEPLAVYPLTYLFLDLLDLPNKKVVTKKDNLVVGLLTGFIQLTLLPLGLALMLLTCLRYGFTKTKGLGYFVGGILLVVGLVLIFVNPLDYLREVINALKYSVAGLNPIKHPADLFKIIGLPFVYIPYYKDLFAQVILVMTSWWAIAIVFLIAEKQFLRMRWILLVMFTWLVTNTRVAHANEYFYQAFHLIPWLMVGLSGGWMLICQIFRNLENNYKVILWVFLSIEMCLIYTNQHLPLYAKIDPLTENYVQFTPFVQAAETINELKEPGDRLIVIPNESWLYWMTQLEPAPTNMFTYYDWQLLVPKNKSMFDTVLAETPPAFIIYRDDGSPYSPFMNEYLKSNYTLLMKFPQVYLHNSLGDRLKEGYVFSETTQN